MRPQRSACRHLRCGVVILPDVQSTHVRLNAKICTVYFTYGCCEQTNLVVRACACVRARFVKFNAA